MYYFKRRDNSGVSRIFWHCLCDCGNEIDVSNSGFYGNTKSCGCLKRESAIANGKNNLGRRYSEKKPRKNNEFDISGDYGIGYTIKRVSFYFDIDDYDLIKNYCWFMDNKGYIRAKSRNKNKKDYHMLHRLVMNITDPKVHINHKNGIRHDNRKANLRIAIEDGLNKNSINRRIQKNNKSGYTGVKWHSRDSIWEVKIGYNNESHYLGRFNGYDEAVKARKKAEDKMFGSGAIRIREGVMKLLICILGRTASGKMVIRKKLIECGLVPNVTYTSRPMRKGEIDHVDYHFLLNEDFQKKIDENFFTEYKEFETEFGNWRYGSVLTNLNPSVDEVIILTPNGFRDVKPLIKDDTMSIYIYANDATIRKRLADRGDDPGEADRRFQHDKADFKGIECEVDRIVYNNLDEDLNDVVEKIISIVEVYKNRK